MFHGYVDGFQNGRIIGWAVDDAAPSLPIVVEARAAGRVIGLAVTEIERNDVQCRAVVGFEIEIDAKPGVGGAVTVHIAGTDYILPGVPVRVPAPIGSVPRRPPANIPARRPIDVIVPVYRGIEETVACLRSILAAASWDGDLIIINDASPEQAMAPAVAQAVLGHPRKVLIAHLVNTGFPGAVNTGMRHNPAHDVILLNSDALVNGDWIDRLRRAAYSSPEVGTVTALSNEASICSYRGAAEANPAEVNKLTARVNAGIVIDLPTAVGFCMFIKRDCLDEVGLFDAETFGRGYGEENDFCMRARMRGWRHVAAADVFVAHQGGRSFGSDARTLQLRNGALIERFYPGYDRLVQAWIAVDPLRLARRRLDQAQCRSGVVPSVLLIAPDVEGGVARHLDERRRDLATEGRRAVTMLPAGTGDVRLEIFGQEHLKDLVFSIASEKDELLTMLRAQTVAEVELHHMLGYQDEIADLAGDLGVPMTVIIHDYSWICPRLSLINDKRKVCGQPGGDECSRCAAASGARIDLSPDELQQRSAEVFKKAARVIAPSQDAAARVICALPAAKIDVKPWERGAPCNTAARPRAVAKRRRVCVLGAIGDVKGYDLLLSCARDAARRNLPLDFALVGYSQADVPLLATGRVSITGRFEEEEALDLVRGQEADVAFLPSIGPETWSYAMTTLWRAGLDVVALDLGAQAERIRTSGRGRVLPISSTARTINDALVATAISSALAAAE